MITTISKIDENNIDSKKIREAASLINEGQLVAFPTETVYGLGADGLNEEACAKIFKAKGRPADNPLILHISSMDMLYNLVDKVSENASKLIEECWPGPLTIIFKKSAVIPDVVTAGLDTVAIRFPSNKIAQALIKEAATPIAAPSANKSGRPSPTRANDVYYDLEGEIPLILDGGAADIGIESTVIDLSTDIPTILRPGFYTYEYLKEILADVSLDDALVDSKAIPKSPGQKYTHYSPKADLQVYVGTDADLYMLDQAYDYKSCDLKVGVMCFHDSLRLYEEIFTLDMGSRDDLKEMSHNLFTYLREMDKNGIDMILAEGVSEDGLGKSIMNRMKKAAAGDVFYMEDFIC